MDEPEEKRAIAFFDAQNLYRHAKAAFGHHHPNFDPIKLADAVCATNNWTRRGIRLYTGTPSLAADPFWHRYWAKRLLAMRRAGILVTTRPVRYKQQKSQHPDGTTETVTVGHEKGIDVRLALDVVRLARHNQLDVALIFSQDQDLREISHEVRDIAQISGRWIKVACAFPTSPTATATRGIDGTDWFKIDRTFYDACLDPHDYRT